MHVKVLKNFNCTTFSTELQFEMHCNLKAKTSLAALQVKIPHQSNFIASLPAYQI
jgi:hypothetical protein